MKDYQRVILAIGIVILMFVIMAIPKAKAEPVPIQIDKVIYSEEGIDHYPEMTIEIEISEEEYFWEEYVLTAYCGCEKCCGKWASKGVIKGSGGVPLIQGKHCASPLKNGTQVEIEGMGIYEVQDTPAKWISEKYKGKILDIYFDNHQDALKFGKQKRMVRILDQER